MIDALTDCFTAAERRVEARRLEGEARNDRAPRDPVPCPEGCENGIGGWDYRNGDPQEEYPVACERCDGFGVVERDEVEDA